ncbi:MAG: TPM domain-containing protein, partial [Alphaproteobacteria bacterium]
FMIRPFRRILTSGPGSVTRVRRAALEQFEALGLSHTRDKTGVLIFASLDDRRAEVLADSGIYEKTAPKEWQGVADALVAGLARKQPADGFIAAIEAASEILARHFPRKEDDTNELPNGLVTRKR